MKVNKRRMNLEENMLLDLSSRKEIDDFAWADVEAGEYAVTDKTTGIQRTIKADIVLVDREAWLATEKESEGTDEAMTEGSDAAYADEFAPAEKKFLGRKK